MNRIMAPFAAPQKRRVCREKAAESGGPCPLAAAMDSSAFLTAARSTATTGAWPPPQVGAQWARVLAMPARQESPPYLHAV
jgi:hypothetical protein